MSSHLWWLYNSIEQKKSEGVEFGAVVKYLTQYGPDVWAQFYVWRQGMAKWIPLVDCAELYAHLMTPPPIPDVPLKLHSVPSPKSIPESGTNWAERRVHPRFKIKMEIVLVVGSDTFRTYSSNISLGGVLLAKRAPWRFMGTHECRVFISSPDRKQRIEFRSRVIADGKNPKRIAFQSPNEVFLEALRTWIKGSMKKISKAA
jgi:hypothetical protein